MTGNHPTKQVLFVCNNLNIGGPQKGILAMLERLDRSQVSPTIVSLQPGGDLREHFATLGRVVDVSPVALALQVNKTRPLSDLTVLVRARAFQSVVMYLLAIAAGLAGRPVNPWRQRTWFHGRRRLEPLAGQFDAAFAVSSGLSTYFVVDCVRARRKYHWVVGDYSRTPIADNVDRHYLRQLSGGMAVSQECADIFLQLFDGLQSHPITVYTFPVPYRYYAATQGGGAPEFDEGRGIKILTATRLEEGKGIPLAVATAEILMARGVAFRWLVLGDGSQRADLERGIEQRGLGAYLVPCGFRSNMADYLQAADVFVLPSTSEGRSVALDEAMAFRVVPVVTNFRTASSQVTDGDTGFICEFTPEDLADHIELAVDPTTRERILGKLGMQAEVDPTPLIQELAE